MLMALRNRSVKLPAIVLNGKELVKYDPLIALEVVERVSNGDLLQNITKKPFPITKGTFLQWVSSVPELQKAYLTAKKLSAMSFEEKAIHAAEQLIVKGAGKDLIAATNTLISQYRWTATRRDPTTYSDKGNTNIVVPVNINTTLDMGNGDKVEDNSIYTLKVGAPIDADYTEIEEEIAPEASEEIREEESGEEKDRHGVFASLLQTDEPVLDVERQPLLQAARKKLGSPPGPRKRVLTPRKK